MPGTAIAARAARVDSFTAPAARAFRHRTITSTAPRCSLAPSTTPPSARCSRATSGSASTGTAYHPPGVRHGLSAAAPAIASRLACSRDGDRQPDQRNHHRPPWRRDGHRRYRRIDCRIKPKTRLPVATAELSTRPDQLIRRSYEKSGPRCRGPALFRSAWGLSNALRAPHGRWPVPGARRYRWSHRSTVQCRPDRIV